MKHNRRLLILAILSVLMLVLSACAGDGEPADNASGNDNGQDGGGDITIAVGEDVVSMSTQGTNDVPSSNVTENVYETLTVLDDDQKPQPGLAKEWKEIDETTWEFYLKEGVEFHDGTELTAEAVKKTFDRLVDEKIGSPRAFLLDPVDSWEVVDDYTFRVHLKFPFAPLLANLAHIGTGIMSPEVIEEDYAQMEDGGDPDAYINKNPVGTGPFEFESWTPGEKVVLKRFDGYHGEKAKLDTATFKVVTEQSSRIAELETGASHVVDEIGPNNVSRVENSEGISLIKQPSVSLNYVGFNVQKEPFDDVKVRQAISMATNKEDILEGVYNGIGIPAKGPLAPPIFGYDEDVEDISYDLDQAKELLKEAGYEDGFETTLWTNDSEERVDTAIAMQAQLKEIGIDVKIEELEWGAYLERLANGEHDMFILGWSTVNADADQGLYQLFHSSQHGATGNRTFIDDEELDNLLDEGRKETDPDKRLEIYAKAQERLVELAPMLYLNHREYLVGVNDSVKDFSVSPQGIYQIKEAYIED